jgi:hypothetical protein
VGEPWRHLAEEELGLASACAALATRLDQAAAELTTLVDEHLWAAACLAPGGAPTDRPLSTTLRQLATAAATVARGERAALSWLREREHRLVLAYLALDDESLDEPARRRLRQTLLPAAYARFTAVDRLVAAHEADEGALA